MVSNAKKEHNNCASARKKTGGGQQPVSPKGTTRKIIELFGEDPAFSGIAGGVDSGKRLQCLQLFPSNETVVTRISSLKVNA